MLRYISCFYQEHHFISFVSFHPPAVHDQGWLARDVILRVAIRPCICLLERRANTDAQSPSTLRRSSSRTRRSRSGRLDVSTSPSRVSSSPPLRSTQYLGMPLPVTFHLFISPQDPPTRSLRLMGGPVQHGSQERPPTQSSPKRVLPEDPSREPNPSHLGSAPRRSFDQPLSIITARLKTVVRFRSSAPGQKRDAQQVPSCDHRCVWSISCCLICTYKFIYTTYGRLKWLHEVLNQSKRPEYEMRGAGG
jgi:hypothetical protein